VSVFLVIDLIICLLGFIALGVGIYLWRQHGAKRMTWIGVGVLALGVVLIGMACLTSVPAQNVGVVTSFGKPVRNLDPGIHTKAPWRKVIDMDGTIQIDDNLGDKRTEIRLGSGANAYVQNALRWKIRSHAAPGLWADYHKSGQEPIDRISSGLVEQELAAALNSAFASYNPLAGQKVSYDTVAADVVKRLVGDRSDPNDPASATGGKIGDRIIVESFIIPKVDFDDATQHRIDSKQQAVVETEIATQRKLTATQDALADEERAKGLGNDRVLVARCLDYVKATGGSPFGCWPGTGSVMTDTRK
jgi:regulator of protease activity HflC (stomatin/prohibitin superfamily)